MKIIIIVCISWLIGVIVGGLSEMYDFVSWVNYLMGFGSMTLVLVIGFMIDMYFD